MYVEHSVHTCVQYMSALSEESYGTEHQHLRWGGGEADPRGIWEETAKIQKEKSGEAKVKDDRGVPRGKIINNVKCYKEVKKGKDHQAEGNFAVSVLWKMGCREVVEAGKNSGVDCSSNKPMLRKERGR